MFAIYQLASALLFLVLTTILIQQRLLARWILFALLFLLTYIAGAYLWFGRDVVPLPHGIRDSLPVFLATFGLVGVIGVCLYKQYTLAQTVGVTLCAVVLIIGWVLLTDASASPDTWVIWTSILLVVGGLPGIYGYALTRAEWGPTQRSGAVLLYLAVSILILTAVGLVFGFEPIEPWIEKGRAQLARIHNRLSP